MNNQIKCPYCNKSFEPTEAYKHELEEGLLREVYAKHQKEVKSLKDEKDKLGIEYEKNLLDVGYQIKGLELLELDSGEDDE